MPASLSEDARRAVMENNPKVFVGGHALEMEPSAGGKRQVMAYTASAQSRGGTPAGTPCHYSLKIKPDHPNVHLKTKAHWIIGWVPPPEKHGKKRTFYAARRWVNNGFVRYWGFVTFDGQRHYGWLDHLHLENHKGKGSQKPGSYDDYRNGVISLMKRAWRYRSKEHHKIPVNALIRSTALEVKLYKNRKASEANLAATVKKKHGAHGFNFAIRYATKTWILVKYGSGHEWYFLKASYKHVELNPKRPERDKETQTMTPKIIPPAWA
jgi:hypothetical protein